MTAAGPWREATGFGWWQGTTAPLAVWSAGPATAGPVAVLPPPVGSGSPSAARLLTALADGLADQGLQALLLDHRGTGDSFGALTSQRQALDDVEGLVAALVADGAAVTLVGL